MDGGRRKATVVAAIVILALTVNPITLALLLRTVGNFEMDGSGMYPTIENGDRVLVTKIGGPGRRDVLVFHDPRSPDEYLIKRTIGLPGETVEIANGKVFINDKPIDESYIKRAWHDTTPKVQIGADEYFVMGDNRENSLDSRSAQVGPVHRDLIVGTALLTYWPISANPGGFAALLTVGLLLLALEVGLTTAAFIVAHRRKRSGWWASLAWWLGAPGLLAVYLWVKSSPVRGGA